MATAFSAIVKNEKKMRKNMCKDMRKHVNYSREDGRKYVTVPIEEWNSQQETLHLFSSPANAHALLKSIAALNAGRGIERELFDLHATR